MARKASAKGAMAPAKKTAAKKPAAKKTTPKGDKATNKAGAEGKDVPTASGSVSTKHNSAPTTKADRATFTQHLAKIKAKTREKDRVVGELRALRKKAEKAGIVLADMDRAVKIADMVPAAVRGSHNNVTIYLRFMDVPIGEQLTLIGLDDSPMDDERVYRESKAAGVQAGVAGDSNNPHELNSNAGRGWAEGYAIGQQKRRDDMAFDMEKRNKEKADAKAAKEAEKAAKAAAAADPGSDSEKENGDADADADVSQDEPPRSNVHQMERRSRFDA